MLQSLKGLSYATTLTCVLVALASVAFIAEPASAHAKLLGTAPGDGATVTDPLAAVILEFNQTVSAPHLTVARPDGKPLAVGAPQAQDRKVIQPLPSLTQQGVYTVTYRVISTDKDPVSGQFTFTYNGPIQQAQPAPPPAMTQATPSGEATSAIADDNQPAGAEPTNQTRTGGLIWLITAVVLLGMIGAAWYALTRKRTTDP
jgi:methionine-rich copper-binding protein CopC